MGFPTGVTFWFWQVNSVDGSILRFNVMVPVFSQFVALKFIVIVFATVKAIPSLVQFFLGFLRGNDN